METGSTTSSTNQEYDPLIVIPGRITKNRIPGYYPDIPSREKTKNNTAILHASKLLKAYSDGNGISALVLDGKEMRTTRTLEFLGGKLRRVNVVEYNNQTYEKMLRDKKDKDKVHCYNCHIKEYIDHLNDTNTNLVYFDIMSTLFSSEKSYGSDIIINQFLRQSSVNEIILAATFCLRNSSPQSFEIQQRKILLLLSKIFLVNGFGYKLLLPLDKLRYKGQNTGNKSMMFVLFYLKKEETSYK